MVSALLPGPLAAPSRFTPVTVKGSPPSSPQFCSLGDALQVAIHLSVAWNSAIARKSRFHAALTGVPAKPTPISGNFSLSGGRIVSSLQISRLFGQNRGQAGTRLESRLQPAVLTASPTRNSACP